MKSNLGTQDRLMRAAIGILILVGILTSPTDIFTFPALYYGTIVLGVMSLFNSMSSICIIFKIIGMNTCPMNDQTAEQV